MKITRLTTYWDADQVVELLTFLDQLRDALYVSYQHDIEQWQAQQWNALQPDRSDQVQDEDPFDDPIDF